MTLDELADLVNRKRAEYGGDVDITTLEYAGGNDVPCDIVGLDFDEETRTLRVRTVHR